MIVKKPDPKRRKLKGVFVCAVCKKPLDEIVVRDGDPFCSVECCRAFHDTEIALPNKQIARGR